MIVAEEDNKHVLLHKCLASFLNPFDARCCQCIRVPGCQKLQMTGEPNLAVPIWHGRRHRVNDEVCQYQKSILHS